MYIFNIVISLLMATSMYLHQYIVMYSFINTRDNVFMYILFKCVCELAPMLCLYLFFIWSAWFR